MNILESHRASDHLDQTLHLEKDRVIDIKNDTDEDIIKDNIATLSVSHKNTQKDDLATLRTLLLGKEYDDLIAFKKNHQNHTKHSQAIANVISEALDIRSTRDGSVAKALSPTIEQALVTSINENPKPIADALYPVMGPAIRKLISESLSQMLATFNQLLERSLSPKSILWRLDAWRTGRSYSEVILLKTLVYQVEEVFLIHRDDGLLLQHASLGSVIIQDSDMVSGMLTAIQDFISDSFAVEGGEHSGLNTLRLGDLTVIIEHGPKAALAAVVRGKPPENIRLFLTSSLEAIHHQHRNDFIEYNGDNSPFDRSQQLLQRCLKVQKQEKTKNYRPAIIALSLFMLGTGYWGYIKYQQHQIQQQTELAAKVLEEKLRLQWQSVLSTLRNEPGLVVIHTEKGLSDNEIEVLLDPLARQPAQVISHLTFDTPIVFKTKPYLSTEDGITLSRAKHLLHAPEQVTFDVENAVLQVSGKASLKWEKHLQKRWQQIPGIQQLDTSSLLTYDSNLPIMNALKQEIEQSKVLFDSNDAKLTTISHIQLQIVSRSLDTLIRLAKQSQKSVKVSLTGHTDNIGTERINTQLALQRMKVVKEKFIALGVPEFSFVDQMNVALQKKDERSVRYQINIIENR